MSSPIRRFYEFGPFVLDASERQLLRGEETVRLTPKEFETLHALVRGGGRVMPKEELLKEIWPDTFVEEATLAQNVFTLRKALAKCDESGRQYIETVPRRGYRFAAKVRERLEEVSAGDSFSGESFGGPAGGAGRAGAGVGNANGGPAVASAAGEGSAGGTAPEVAPARAETPAGQMSPVAQGGAKYVASNGRAARTALDGAAASPQAAAAPSPTIDALASAAPGRVGLRPRAAVLITAVALLAFAALAYAVFRLGVRREAGTTTRPRAFEEMKVTRLPVTGSVVEAVISPDGKWLAYVADEPERQGASVWVRQVAAASNIQRIVPPAEGTYYGGLVFSPDSQHVYFGTFRGGGRPSVLSRVPVFGGAVEKILERVNSPVTFSPDGARLALTRGNYDEENALVVADAGGGGERTLATRKGPVVFGLPAWSPDGKTIACVYGTTENLNSGTPALGVTSFSAADGSETKVTDARWVGVSQLAWLPDSKGLVVSASEQELSPSQIWQLSFPSGEARRVTNDLNTYLGVSLTADASALVTVQTDRVPNVWVAPQGDAARARQVTTGAGKFDGYYGLSWTPDGRIVYASIASGSWDIWVMDADGSNPKQLTVGARSNYGPSVSADGRYIVFISNRAGGAFNVWRMDADGSNPKQLTFGRGENFAHVTPDGRWVVYATVGFGQENLVWKVPVDGGEAVRLTDRPSSWPFVSPDGKWVVCTYGEGHGPVKLAVIPVEGGQPAKLFDTAPSFRANTVWLPDNRGIAFLDSRTGTTNVWMQPLGGGKPVQLTDFKADNVTAYDFSRDRQLAASRSVETTGVVLIRDFR